MIALISRQGSPTVVASAEPLSSGLVMIPVMSDDAYERAMAEIERRSRVMVASWGRQPATDR